MQKKLKVQTGQNIKRIKLRYSYDTKKNIIYILTFMSMTNVEIVVDKAKSLTKKWQWLSSRDYSLLQL